jgi:hemerythrin-like domain-containing protein
MARHTDLRPAQGSDRPAVVETRVVHEAQRRATSMLSAATRDGSASPSAVAEMRDFVVTSLEHHHRSEDADLWPLLIAAAPDLTEPLRGLSREHDRLDATLRRLGQARVGDADNRALTAAADDVRDLVHEHLSHEEPIVLPALQNHVSDEEWAAFSRRTIESAPAVGGHLLLAMFDLVGSPGEVELIVRHLPPVAIAMAPTMRERARSTFAALGGAAQAAANARAAPASTG